MSKKYFAGLCAVLLLFVAAGFAASDDNGNTNTNRPLQVNQTEGYGDGQLLVFTYFQNFHCTHQPFDDLDHNNLVAAVDPAEFQKPIEEVFTSFENLRYQIAMAANKIFGSGWVWLVLDSSKKLALMTTANQDSPLSVGKYPLLGIDCWEHAYYLRFKNSRTTSYLPAFMNVIDWKFVTARYQAALKK